MSSWTHTVFGDLYAEPSRNGVTIPKDDRGSGIPMIGMGDLFETGRIGIGDYELVPLPDRLRVQYTLMPGDLLFARRSLTLAGAGVCRIVTDSFEATFESSIIRCRLDSALGDPAFYYYYFNTRRGRAVIEEIVEQTAVAGIRSSDLSRRKVPSPPMATQRAIASILGALDDKIDHNGRLGKQVTQYLWGLLRYHETVDDGAEDSVLGDIASRVVEKVDDSSDESGRPLVELSGMPKASLVPQEWGDGQDIRSRTRFRRHDTLFGLIRPYLHKVVAAPCDGLTNTSVLVLRPNDSDDWSYLAAVASAPRSIAYAERLSGGTTMPTVRWKDMLEMPVPGLSLLGRRQFASVANPLLDLASACAEESRTLVGLRNLLASELVSGRLHPEQGLNTLGGVT